MPVCDDNQAGNRSGENAAQREGDGDHPVGPHAQYPRHAKVFGGGAHLQAKPRRLQEPGQGGEEHDADDDGDDLQELQADAGELDLAAKLGQEVDPLQPRSDHKDQDLLQEEAHREGGD